MDNQATFGSLNLKQLLISNTKLIDGTGVKLIEGMHIANPDLRELDLSQNKISDRTWKVMNKFLETQYSIRNIDLKWNHISSYGVKDLMEGIYKGRSCKNLNLSYNWLSRGQSTEMVSAMMKAINETIVHLDLSNNNLSEPVWERFGELLTNNHTLYGLHMHGNNWYVDGHGFIKVGEHSKDFNYSKNTVISPTRITGHSNVIRFTSKNPFQFVSVTKWWVWEGWSECTFVIDPNKSMTNIEEPLHLHFDYNYYEPELMTLQKDGTYSYTTMWPPGRVLYFFTVNKIVVNAKDHLRIKQKFTKFIENIEHYDEVKNYKISKFHYRVVSQSMVLDENYFSLLKECIPRPHLQKYVKPEVQEIRDPWLFETSVFAKYIQDTEELITKWFEFDWKLMQKPKFDDGSLLLTMILFHLLTF